MLSITLAILALYALDLAKSAGYQGILDMASQPRVGLVYWTISLSLAITAIVAAAWREISRKG